VVPSTSCVNRSSSETSVHGATSQKKAFFIVTAVKTSNLTKLSLLHGIRHILVVINNNPITVLNQFRHSFWVQDFLNTRILFTWLRNTQRQRNTVIGPYLKPVKSSLHHYALFLFDSPMWPLPVMFLTKMVYAFLIFFQCALHTLPTSLSFI
jgi:hypothetical protein